MNVKKFERYQVVDTTVHLTLKETKTEVQLRAVDQDGKFLQIILGIDKEIGTIRLYRITDAFARKYGCILDANRRLQTMLTHEDGSNEFREAERRGTI